MRTRREWCLNIVRVCFPGIHRLFRSTDNTVGHPVPARAIRFGRDAVGGLNIEGIGVIDITLTI